MNQIIKKAKQVNQTRKPSTYSKRDQIVRDYAEVAIAVANKEITIQQVAKAKNITEATAYYRILSAPYQAVKRGIATITWNA